MNKFLKATLALLMCVLLMCSICGCSSQDAEETEATTQSTEPPAKYSIGVIQTDDTDNAKEAYNGFIRAFSEKGYEQGQYYNITVKDCNNNGKECTKVAKDFVESGVDLIFTFDVKATIAAKKATKEIPIIFCGVYDPIESKIMKSCEKPEANVTGVSDFTPVKGQFEFIKRILPNAKNVHSLYMSTDPNSVLISTLAKSEAKALGLKYTPFAIINESQLEDDMSDIFEGADALYLCEDEITLENADAIIKAANKAKVPIFSATNSFMSFGTFATCLPDYEDLGFNAGELALICLKDLHPISNISVEYPVRYKEYVSESVAKKLGIKVEASDTLTLIK